MPSTQQMRILKLISEYMEGKATPNDVKVLYEEKYKETKGNTIYNQIQRLVEDGFLKRVDYGKYTLSKKAKSLFGKETIEKPKDVIFSEEEVLQFHQFAQRHNSLSELVQMANPDILGYEKEQLACLASIVSMPDKYENRNRISVLLYGDVSTGKTTIIRNLHRKLWGVYISHITSEGGLRGIARGSVYSKGKLQEADNSVLFINELDKISPADQDVLLDAIETGKIHINIGNVSREDNTRIRCIAVCNNKEFVKNELWSRFDIRLYMKPLSKEEEARLIRKKANDWNRPKEYSNGFFSRYMQYVNQYETSLPSDREELIEYIIKEHQYGSLSRRDIRGIESVFRVALAIARLKLHKEVQTEDIKTTLELMRLVK